MDKLLDTDRAFPAWLTLSWAWEEAMDDPNEVKATLARNLRRLREKRGLTQRALADRARVSLVALKRIESAKTLPDIAMMARFAEVFDLPCTDFLSPTCRASARGDTRPVVTKRAFNEARAALNAYRGPTKTGESVTEEADLLAFQRGR